MKKYISYLLSDPLTKGLDLDSPITTELRKQIIKQKPFLNQIYEDWYAALLKEIDPNKEHGLFLEIGSGAGYFKEKSNQLISSDVLVLSGLDIVLDGQFLPFANSSLKGILFINVLHHIPNPKRLFAEMVRTLKPEGVVAIIEPWITSWSRIVYKYLHHEPIDESIKEWKLENTNPLTSANSALPFLIFDRDRSNFRSEFPRLEIQKVTPFMPFRYLLAGGISMRALMPASSYGFWRLFENMLTPLNHSIAMFAKIVLKRTEK